MSDVATLARSLVDDPPGTNPEYERALVELVVLVNEVGRDEAELALFDRVLDPNERTNGPGAEPGWVVKLAEGTLHATTCNADHGTAVGSAGCSCPAGRAIKTLRHECALLRAVAAQARTLREPVGYEGGASSAGLDDALRALDDWDAAIGR